MEVLDTWQSGQIFAALIKGFPSEYAWYEPGQERTFHLIIRTENKHFYLFHDEQAETIFREIRETPDQRAYLAKLFSPESLFLIAPLTDGKIYGNDGKIRQDQRYCWRVKKDPKRNSQAFILRMDTLPDRTEISFVPGLGIYSYIYIHSGTVAETRLYLIDIERPNATQSRP